MTGNPSSLEAALDELVERLARGDHPVTVSGPSDDVRKRVTDLEYVLIKFTATRGGTELGARLDSSATDVSSADFEAGTGPVHVEGTLVLNDHPVRLVADIDLATLDGTGHLVPIEESELIDAGS